MVVPAPVLFWKLDDNAANTTIADSVGAYTATSSVNTSTLIGVGKDGKANTARGNTATNYFYTASHPFGSDGDMSISYWAKQSSTTGAQNIIGAWGTNNFALFQYDTGGTTFTFYLGRGGTYYTLSAHAHGIDTTKYHKVTITYKASTTTFTLYINGISATSVSSGSATSTARTYFNVGGYAGADAAAATSNTFLGLIDEMKGWTETLTDEQVYTDYLNEKDQRNACVLDLKLNEGAGTTARDGSGNGNDGTITTATWSEGIFGPALTFDGTNDYVTISDSTSIRPVSDISFGGWVLITSAATAYGMIMAKGELAGDTRSYEMRRDGTSTRMEVKLNTSTGIVYCLTTNSLGLGSWNHVMFTRTGTTNKIYFNGVEEVLSSNITQSGTINYSTDDLWLGQRNGGLRHNGKLDQMQVFSRQLSAAEVMEEAYRIRPTGVGGPVVTTNLVAYYPLQNISDHSGNGNDLTNIGVAFDRTFLGPCANFSDSNSANYLRRAADIISYAQFGTAWTFNIWFKCADYSALNRIFRYILNNGSLERNFSLDITTGGVFSFGIFDGGNYFVTGTTVISTNEWNMATIKYDGTMRLYLNGIEEGTALTFAMSGYARTIYSNFSIGCEQLSLGGATAAFFNGQMDDLQVYSRSLSVDEIRAIYSRSPRINVR